MPNSCWLKVGKDLMREVEGKVEIYLVTTLENKILDQTGIRPQVLWRTDKPRRGSSCKPRVLFWPPPWALQPCWWSWGEDKLDPGSGGEFVQIVEWWRWRQPLNVALWSDVKAAGWSQQPVGCCRMIWWQIFGCKIQDHLLNKLQDDLIQNMLALLEEEANSAPAILKVSESYSALDFSLTCFRLTGIAQKQSSWNKRRRHWNSFVHNYVVNIYSEKQTTWRELIHTLKWKKRQKRCTLHLKEDPASYKCC